MALIESTASNLLVIAATVCFVALVAAGAWLLSYRQSRPQPALSDDYGLPQGASSVLSVLPGSAIVVTHGGVVLRASAPAYAQGLVHGNAVTHDGLTALIDQVRGDAQIREQEYVLPPRPGSPERVVGVRVAPLGSGLILALVEDRTRERQLQVVRRDFVANVSHELKTPVGAIRLLSEASRDAAEDPEAIKRFAKRTRKEADRLARLVQQIIELSRLQGDEPVESPELVSLDKVVAAAVDTTSIDAEARQVSVVVDGEADLSVLGSEEQLVIGVGNLVANAVSYSPEGATVVVRVTRAADHAEVSVIDQGIGIPAGELERIFERFYRVDPARHRSTGGTGLGLSIVKHVAATHGGEVRAWSVQGQGSTFTLSLPIPSEESAE